MLEPDGILVLNAINLIIGFKEEQMSIQRKGTKEYIESIFDIHTIYEQYKKVLKAVYTSK